MQISNQEEKKDEFKKRVGSEEREIDRRDC